MPVTVSANYGKNLICWLLAAIWFPCLASCNGSTPFYDCRAGRIPTHRIEAGVHSFLREEGMHFQVYFDEDSFSKAYVQIHSGTLPKPKVPEIEFENHVVIGAFLGSRPTAGYGIDLGPFRSIPDKGGESLEVIVRIVEPPPDAILAQVLTSPYILVQVLRGKWNRIRFRDMDGHLIAELADSGSP